MTSWIKDWDVRRTYDEVKNEIPKTIDYEFTE